MNGLDAVGNAKCPCCGQATKFGIRWSLEARARWQRGAAHQSLDHKLIDSGIPFDGAVANEQQQISQQGGQDDTLDDHDGNHR